MTNRIVHLGLGAFFRAHQAAYTQAANMAAAGEWQIEPVAMRNPVQATRLNAQNGRYAVIERHPEGPRAIPITCLGPAWSLPDAPERVIARLADPDVHVVTITVTEKGYGLSPDTGGLDPRHPAVAHDLIHHTQPTGLIGTLVAGLAARRAAGGSGLTLISCDNLPSNGTVLSRLLQEFATRMDPELAAWIATACTCPETMVDRITPAATAATATLAEELTGVADPMAIETEPFRQWVIQDRFAGPVPDWRAAGAQVVPDVAPYETMKLRMLNGAHSLIAYLGTVGDLPAVRDVMATPPMARLVRQHMDAAAATLDRAHGLDTAGYADALIARFENPAIDHRCVQIAMDGSQKLPQRLFSGAADRLAQGQSVDTFACATALWLRHIEGRSDRGDVLALQDPLAADLQQAVDPDAQRFAQQIGALPGLAGHGLFARADWIAAVSERLTVLRQAGVTGLLKTL